MKLYNQKGFNNLTVLKKTEELKMYLALLRDPNTQSRAFYKNIGKVSRKLGQQAFRSLPVELEPTDDGLRLMPSGKNIALVPILRAGLGMVDPLHSNMKDASVGLMV